MSSINRQEIDTGGEIGEIYRRQAGMRDVKVDTRPWIVNTRTRIMGARSRYVLPVSSTPSERDFKPSTRSGQVLSAAGAKDLLLENGAEQAAKPRHHVLPIERVALNEARFGAVRAIHPRDATLGLVVRVSTRAAESNVCRVTVPANTSLAIAFAIATGALSPRDSARVSTVTPPMRLAERSSAKFIRYSCEDAFSQSAPRKL